MRKILIHPLAQSDIYEISDWYDVQRTGYGEAFEDDFAACVEVIAEHPETHGVVLKRLGILRAIMPKFLYHIYYSADSEAMKVWTIVHVNRNPSTWKKSIRARYS